MAINNNQLDFFVRLWVFGKEDCYHCKQFISDVWEKFRDTKTKYNVLVYNNRPIKISGCYRPISSISDICNEMSKQLTLERKTKVDVELPVSQLKRDIPAFYLQIDISGKTKFYFLGTFYEDGVNYRNITYIKERITETLDHAINH